MAVDEQIDRLSQQLDKDSIPSVDTLTDTLMPKLATGSDHRLASALCP